MIHFNIPVRLDKSVDNICDAARNFHLSGDGPYTKKCQKWLEKQTKTQKALLTTSGTTALEMAARLCDLKPGDEVIMPSFTFSSTANAVILCGATPVFVDIRPDTMNIDETKIEAAITPKTKAIFVVHYGGVACEMDTIMQIAQAHNLLVVEDAAQCLMATYKGRALGTIGDFGCISFHETKNYTMGEGGALLIHDAKYNEAAEIMREKGTDRAKFFRGQVDKYRWVAAGSSYVPSEINAAYLLPQLSRAKLINKDRLVTWKNYYINLNYLEAQGKAELAHAPEGCTHNAHIFYLKCKDLAQRSALIEHLKKHDVQAAFHYVPLHSAPAGKKYGRFVGKDVYTTKESERLLRLPIYYTMTNGEIHIVVTAVQSFFDKKEGV